MEEEKKLTEEANAPEVKKDDKLFKKPEGKSMYQSKEMTLMMQKLKHSQKVN